MSRLVCLCAALLVTFSMPVLAQAQSSPPQPAETAPSAQVAPVTPAQQTLPPGHPQIAPVAVPPADEASAEAKGSLLPHDLTPWGMFMAADIVVKAVMLGLLFASLVTWTIGLAKSVQLTTANRKASSALKTVNDARSLDDVNSVEAAGGDPAELVYAARAEVHMSAPVLDHADHDGVKERVASRLGRIEVGAGRNMMRGTGLLATIGSTAPFVGLFGTVWGIMNSFIGISQAQTTNLAIVAPGIAEALLATAIGLVAAIPAVIIYNMFARAIAGYRQKLADISAAIERLVSRDLDFRSLPRLRAAAE